MSDEEWMQKVLEHNTTEFVNKHVDLCMSMLKKDLEALKEKYSVNLRLEVMKIEWNHNIRYVNWISI